MKLRLGQPVWTTDGEFGEVGDIVVDPQQRVVTHLVVEPHRQHHRARLVPMSLVSVEGDTVRVDLDAAHLRQLQDVAYDDYVRLGQMIPPGDDWDVGTEDVLALPYWEAEADLGLPMTGDQIEVTYDRIPKGECEIRRTSAVTTDDDRTVGHVEGFLADDNHLAAVVVRTGLPGRRHNVVVPMSRVVAVRNDEIQLAVDRDAFKRFPRAKGLEGPLGESLARTSVKTARGLAERLQHGVAGLAGRAKSTLDRDDEQNDDDRSG
jgi:sporulation protein YlmC with PRC-barrel domain